MLRAGGSLGAVILLLSQLTHTISLEVALSVALSLPVGGVSMV